MGAASAKLHRVTWFLLYLAWLRRADAVGRRLHRENPFDLTFHATYSTYWLPTPATSLRRALRLGPGRGRRRHPLRLWPLLGFRGICGEMLDLVSVNLLSTLPATRRTWRRATVTLVQNPTTLERLPESVRATSRILNHAFFTEAPPLPRTGTGAGPCLFVGSLCRAQGTSAGRASAGPRADATWSWCSWGRQRAPAARPPGPQTRGGRSGVLRGTGLAHRGPRPDGGGVGRRVHRPAGRGRDRAGGGTAARRAGDRARPRWSADRGGAATDRNESLSSRPEASRRRPSGSVKRWAGSGMRDGARTPHWSTTTTGTSGSAAPLPTPWRVRRRTYPRWPTP